MKRHVKAASAGSTSGRVGLGISVCLCALALFTAFVGVASAKTYGPGTPTSFCTGSGGFAAGECGELKGVAVDTSNGHVYAVDLGNFRIDEFDASGAFVKAFGAGVADGTTAAAQVCTVTCFRGLNTGTGAFGLNARGIAVDSTTHIVYAAVSESRVAYFNGTTGAFIGQTEGNTGEINAGAPEGFTKLAGVAIDSSEAQHYLYVTIRPAANRSKLDKFRIGPSGITAASYVCQITGTAVNTSVNSTECGGSNVAAHKNGNLEGIETGTGAGPSQNGGNLAIDPTGRIFVLESNTARQFVSGFARNGDSLGVQFKPVVTGHPVEPRPEAVAALPNGNILVAADGPVAGSGGSVIQEYNPASPGAPLSEFGAGTIGTASGGSLGVATDGASVFVADKVNKKIWKFSPAPEAPAVTTEAATTITKTTATLRGKVNPNFANVSDCHFEYGLEGQPYEHNAPCTPSPGAGGQPVSVSAPISGLSPETAYHFRLLATNSVSTTNGADLQLTTAALSKPAVTTTAGATEIAQTTAKVAGTVNPSGLEVTDCHIAYGLDATYGQTAPCVPANPGSGFVAVDVSASLSGLSPNTTYHFQVVATNGDGTVAGSDQQFKTLPDPPAVSTEPATSVGQVTAIANGKVNPNSGNVTSCKIEYGTTTAYGSQKACVPSPGSGADPVDVSATLTDLSPSTTYHYRLVATNAGGTTLGTDQSFFTLAPNPPGAITDAASTGPGQTLTLQGHLDPNGIAVSDCHFAYGTGNEYEKTAPCTPSAANLGNGDSPLAVTAATEPLEPNTTYHYRLFATNVRGSVQGKDRIFTTGAPPADACPNAAIRAAQGIEVSLLPQCMALEQASPSRKANQSAKNPQAISADGDRVLFISPATLGVCPLINGLGGDPFLALRDQSGWSTECTTPPVDDELGTRFIPFGYTPNYSHWFQYISGPDGPQFFNLDLDGQLAPISPPLENLTGTGGPGFQGASSDHSHLFLLPESPGSEPRSGSFLPGDPLPDGPGADANLYAAHLDSSGQPTLELLARDRNGKAWGANCGARLGGMERTFGSDLNLPNGERNQGAISADGSRVYFSTRPSQPPSGNCTEANKKRIMVREETPAGPEIEELIASECTRVSPACSTTDGDDAYQGASVDQSKVYFTTSRQLDDADRDGGPTSCDFKIAVSGCDLYLYDADEPAGERLIDVSAGDSTAATPGEGASVRNSITAISADGSHVYFVARTVLTTDPGPTGATAQNAANNLYLYDHSNEELSFVGTVAAADGGSLFGGNANWENDAYPVPITGTDSEGNEVGGDGHVLLFSSKAQLSAEDTDSATDIYRYDAEADTLELLSKAGPGGTDNGAFDAITVNSGSIGTDYAEKGRWASEDGETVAFTSKEALLPGDTNAVEDSFLWREGQLYHLPGSARSSLGAAQITPVVSHDGRSVAYHSTKRLTASDGDSIDDVYVLRANGGFPIETRSICEGEACQGSPSTISAEIGAGSGSFVGAGNVKPTGSKARNCPKGKRKVRSGGKSRCVKQAKHKKKAAAKKRAGAKQGGQK